MTELYHIATDYSGPDAGLAAITDGSDHDQELPRPGEQGGLLALEGPPAVEGPGGGSTDEPAAVEVRTDRNDSLHRKRKCRQSQVSRTTV